MRRMLLTITKVTFWNLITNMKYLERARAGEPYIVPQMSDSERNLKIKRFQKPTSGANHGH